MVSSRDLSHLSKIQRLTKLTAHSQWSLIMSLIYQTTLWVHVAVGFMSLVLFWIPVAAKKGGKLHTQTGHWYANTMYAVGFSALALAIMLMSDPIGFKFPTLELSDSRRASLTSSQRDVGLFLMAIAILVIVGVRHGLQTIQAKGNHAVMRRSDNIAINVILLAVGLWLGFTATGNSPMNVLFYIFAALCSITAIGNLRYCFKERVTRPEQIIAHLSAIIGAGIGSHTAFFVFGASRLFSELLTGYFALIPWVAPGVIGTLLIAVQAKKYQPRKAKKVGQSVAS